MLDSFCKLAREIGFDEAKPLKVATLKPMKSVRDMCAEDKCRAYQKNWTCPPAIGTLEECEARMQCYSYGILLQTVGHLQKRIDSRTIRDTERRHMEYFRGFSDKVREVYPDALCLGAGGCRICKTCAFPEPCRFPEKALSSMEGYGLFVTQVCRDNDLPYYHGEGTITYTACVLFGRKETEECQR